MARRQLGHGRGGRMKIESDSVEIRSGVRHGRTLGSPVAVLVANRDYANWEERMNPWPVDAEVEEVHTPRPGHADLAGLLKYGHADVRNVLERASARETAARVAAGSARQGAAARIRGERPQPRDADRLGARRRSATTSRPRTSPASTSRRSAASTPRPARRWSRRSTGCARRTRASAGSSRCGPSGSFPASARTSSWEERLDGRLAQALVSIQAVKGVSVGEAWEVAGRPGSESHDEIFWSEERGWHRETNRAGGVEGGMSNGEPLIVRGALKPISTLTKPLRSVDTETKEPAQALRERTDSTVVPAAGVVGEAMVALVLARATARSSAAITSTTRSARLDAYRERIGWRR